MKVKELITFLQQYDPEEVIYLLNGVSGGDPIRAEDFQWDTYKLSPGRYYPPVQSGPWKPDASVPKQGPTKPVLCIYGE